MRSLTLGKLDIFYLYYTEPSLRAHTHTNFNMPEVPLAGHLNR